MQAASTNPELGLEHLFCAMAAGDRTALSLIYRRTVPHIFAIARGMLRSREDAEEVVCEVYTHAWQHASSFDVNRGGVMAWLAVMARNRAIDRLRQRREWVSLDAGGNDAVAASTTSEALGPEQILVEWQSGNAVHRALESLTPQRRRLVGLAFFDGLSHRQIAEVVGLPLGTVKSHVRRALAALQCELSQDP